MSRAGDLVVLITISTEILYSLYMGVTTLTATSGHSCFVLEHVAGSRNLLTLGSLQICRKKHLRQLAAIRIDLTCHVAERKDLTVRDWNKTDDEGRLITEHPSVY